MRSGNSTTAALLRASGNAAQAAYAAVPVYAVPPGATVASRLSGCQVSDYFRTDGWGSRVRVMERRVDE